MATAERPALPQLPPQTDPLLTHGTTALRQALIAQTTPAPTGTQLPWSPPPASTAPPTLKSAADWLASHELGGVDARDAADLPPSRFAMEFMVPNRPVLITVRAVGDAGRAAAQWVNDRVTSSATNGLGLQGAMTGWSALRDWVGSEGGRPPAPNLSALLQAAGRDAHVVVTDTARQQDGPGPCTDTTLGVFADWWHARRGGVEKSDGGTDLPPGGHWYLKDWHFVAACPTYKAYTVPPQFCSDWLNEHYDRLAAVSAAQGVDSTTATASGKQRSADYRFVYLGPAGSWTPLHADVLRSFSWSANVAGRKLWLLLPPEHTHLAYDRAMASLAPEFGHACWRAVAGLPGGSGHPPIAPPAPAALAARFPGLTAAHPHLKGVIQGPGEVLFVPSGWHHTVLNLDDTLSINHNWINGHNVAWCLRLVAATHLRAAASIQDCRPLCASPLEFWALVQRLVEADAGLGLQGLAHLCAGVIARALPQATSTQPDQAFDARRAVAALAGVVRSVRRWLGEQGQVDQQVTLAEGDALAWGGLVGGGQGSLAHLAHAIGDAAAPPHEWLRRADELLARVAERGR